MKYIFLLFSLLATLQLSAATHTFTPIKKQIKMEEAFDDAKTIRYDYLSAGSGILGLVLAFMPFLSIVGVILGIAAIVFSIIAFRKKQKSRWLWLGLIAGSLTILAFLGVIGLVLFF